MVKSNYRAWHITLNALDTMRSDTEKLIHIAQYAVLAPSGHNSQPWKLTTVQDSLLVDIHPDHHLSGDGSGLLSVEPYISIGTFLETFELAAAGLGYTAIVELFPDSKHIARITLDKPSPPRHSLLTAIRTRVSNRHAFETTQITPAALKTFIGSELSGIATTQVTAREDVEFLAEQTELAVAAIMSNPKYRRELSEWVRTNHTRKYDGMPGFTHGFGTVKSLLSKVAVRHAKGQGPQVAKSGKLMRSSGALVIVRSTDNTNESFINAGRMYARVCIHATETGLATSALGASVIDPNTREGVREYFRIKDRPIYILRIGYPTIRARHSPRWPIEKILTRRAS